MKAYSPDKIEPKWRKKWEKEGNNLTPDKAKNKDNSMLLVEFPYPSGNLHIGHWYAFALPDIYARFLKMNGKNVMYPIGFDAFGLPAENAAIKRKINPRDWTEQNIKYMTKQLKSMGASFDWSRVVSTIDPEYYRWTQWIFLKMFEKGLAYREKTLVNWCPSCKTVLANEQVVGGECERCGAEVNQKEIEQWMFRITAYADDLVDGLKNMDWPETTKIAQANWIGRSEGTEFDLAVVDSQEKIKVFTTRLDTVFGMTYAVVAPEHPIIEKMKDQVENYLEVKKYISQAKKKSNLERTELQKEKTGVKLQGIEVVNPFNEEAIPLYVADYVLGSYGTGAVMAVPAHDERDFDFAKKHKIAIREIIVKEKDQKASEKMGQAFTQDGFLINSGEFSYLTSEKARLAMTKWLEKEKIGKKKINFKLHDWVLSRQRYWGVPIPIIHCSKCGYLPVKEKELPVILPKLKDFLPSSDGRSPLAKAKKWAKVKCPQCGNWAERETDTMDTFVDSSWYFIRYTDPKNKKAIASEEKMKAWLPVSLYVGGAEHNTMHLLYSRFFTKVLHDLGYTHFAEPFSRRINHGIILGPDGQKMSKSRGNVIDPDKEVAEYGADSVRMYLAFMGPYDQGGPWQTNGILGIKRFLEKVWKLQYKIERKHVEEKDILILVNKTIKKVAEDIKDFKFNTAISAMMILVNEVEKREKISQEILEKIVQTLSPFAPFMAEELWEKIGHKKSIFEEKWPSYDKALIQDEKVKMVVQINGKLRDLIEVAVDIQQKDAEVLAMQSLKVKNFLSGQKPKKIIFVPKKLINIVV